MQKCSDLNNKRQTQSITNRLILMDPWGCNCFLLYSMKMARSRAGSLKKTILRDRTHIHGHALHMFKL